MPSILHELRSTLGAEMTGRWFIEHHLLRETQSLLPKGTHASTLSPRYLQIFTTSVYPRETFIGMTPSTTPSPNTTDQKQHTTITTIPSGRDADDFINLTLRVPAQLRMPQPWTLRQTLSLVNGTIWSIPDYRIKVAELRHNQLGIVKGTIVQIEWDDGVKSDKDGSRRKSSAGMMDVQMVDSETANQNQQSQSEAIEKEALQALYTLLTSSLPSSTTQPQPQPQSDPKSANPTSKQDPSLLPRQILLPSWRSGTGVAGPRQARLEERWDAGKYVVEEAAKEEEVRVWMEVLRWSATGRYG